MSRAAEGVVYTPSPLVDLLAEEALAGLADPWVLDPACGEGALLAGVLARGVRPARVVGVDPDTQALAVARAHLGHEVHLHAGDGLAEDLVAGWAPVGAQGGFDAIIANPPYVRQERLGRRFTGTADLYVRFMEQALRCLRPGGRLAAVVPNKWLRVRYGAGLRALLAREATLERLVDFGHAPLFKGADAFPCVVVLRRVRAPGGHRVQVSAVPKGGEGSLLRQVRACAHPVPQARWDRAPWRLEPESLAGVLGRLEDRGTPLVEVLGEPLRRGVLTGLNAAFVVDRATRDALVAADPRSAERLHPVARGRDLGRWRIAAPEHFLIDARRGWNERAFPALRDHLAGHRARLTPKAPGAAGPGRKPGTYRWCELQDTTAYWDLFARPKIVHADLAWRPAFARVPDPLVVLNTAYVWPTEDLWVLAVVNSPVLWTWMWHRATHGKDEALRLIRSFLEGVPIPDAPAAVRRSVGDAVLGLCEGAAGAEAQRLEERVTAGVLEAFGLSGSDRALLIEHAPLRTPETWPGS